MTKSPESRVPSLPGNAVKSCPWCRGRLVFEPYFPVMRLIPGHPSTLREDDLPPPLRTVAAWVCATAHCKYREKA